MISKFIKEKYQEMKKLGKTEDFLDKKHFKELKIFINKKPKDVMISSPLEGDEIYIGTD